MAGLHYVTGVGHIKPVDRGNSGMQLYSCIRDDDDAVSTYGVKFLQNLQGPLCLPNELIGYQIADVLGIEHPDVALVDIQPDVLPDRGIIRFRQGDDPDLLEFVAEPGLHFASRWLESAEMIKPGDMDRRNMVMSDLKPLAGIAVLDILLNNYDRCPGNSNILMVREDGRHRINLIDLGNCFGSAVWSLGNIADPRLPDISTCLPYDKQISFLFSSIKRPTLFEEYLDRLAGLNKARLQEIVASIPDEWGVSGRVREALVDFISLRAQQMPAYMRSRLAKEDWWL